MLEQETSLEKIVSSTFGSYKAEWLKENIYELFTKPNYFPELLTQRPCVLMGGRGTGKTTVLKCLSYEGQYALNDGIEISSWESYGLYYRVNTNRVTAFYGQSKSEEEWKPLFSHYINLIIAELSANFLIWYSHKHGSYDSQTEKIILRNVASSLRVQDADSIQELRNNIQKGKIELENYINNTEEECKPPLSMQAAPLDIFFANLKETTLFKDCYFLILIDEYENFLDYQQRIVNTLIKHASDNYIFKIGVRELGWRERRTLNENESLISPADYNFIDIAERLTAHDFSLFAQNICNDRLGKIKNSENSFFSKIKTALCQMTHEEEALELGVDTKIASEIEELKRIISKQNYLLLVSKPQLEQYALLYFSKKDSRLSPRILEDMLNSGNWKTKYDNYKFALLFTIASKSPGVKKYYAGWNTLVNLSGGNIRYLLELVEQSLLLHIKKENNNFDVISCEVQTRAAINIAKKNLNELEGLTTHGALLTRLLLSLGRIFGLMAESVDNSAPEKTQFQLADDSDNINGEHKLEELFKAAVMNLAFLRFRGSKLSTKFEIRDYDYMLHPIFAPLFVYSYRKKRKIKFSSHDISSLINTPSLGIKSILKQTDIEVQGDLPQQLSLFAEHFK